MPPIIAPKHAPTVMPVVPPNNAQIDANITIVPMAAIHPYFSFSLSSSNEDEGLYGIVFLVVDVVFVGFETGREFVDGLLT